MRALGADVAGRASLSMGTSGVLSVPWRTVGLPAGWGGAWHLFPTSVDGAFGVIATIPALAGSLTWVARLLGTDVAGLARLAASGRARDVRFFPYLGGSGAPHPDVTQRGQLRGLAETTTTVELARGVLEGVASELAMLVEETRDQGVPIGEVVLSGGLAALDPLASLIGGRTGLPLWRSSVHEASAVGAALIGLDGVGAGHHATGARARVTVRARDRAPVDDRWRAQRQTILGEPDPEPAARLDALGAGPRTGSGRTLSRSAAWERYADLVRPKGIPGPMRSLLDEPSSAVLAIRQEDGEPIVSPVWYRVNADAFEVVVAISDCKLEHLRRDPRCVLLVFEAVPPFRGVQVRGTATLIPDEGARARLAIASRYLGAERGARYADLARRPPGVIVRLPMGAARTWDLADKLP